MVRSRRTKIPAAEKTRLVLAVLAGEMTGAEAARRCGVVSTFCAEHAISRTSFYELRKRARTPRPAAVLEPGSRRPKSSPSRLSDEVKQQGEVLASSPTRGPRPKTEQSSPMS